MKKLTHSLFMKNFTSTGVDVQAVLKMYSTAKYVGQFPLKTRGENFTDYHVDVFYEPKPFPSWTSGWLGEKPGACRPLQPCSAPSCLSHWAAAAKVFILRSSVF